jgi:predicted nucleic acid-binding protein
MILVDVNVFEDVIRKRVGWVESSILLDYIRKRKIKGFISALTVAIIYFLRELPDKEAREKVKEIIKGFEIVPLTHKIIKQSLEDKRFPDFEDAIQFYSAKEKKIKIIITRNKKHFEKVKKEIKMVTPENFIKKYLKI